jgi:hypothetical protein
VLLGKNPTQEPLRTGIIQEPRKSREDAILELLPDKGWPGLARFPFEPVTTAGEGVQSAELAWRCILSDEKERP